jgi:hypothetical protein
MHGRKKQPPHLDELAGLGVGGRCAANLHLEALQLLRLLLVAQHLDIRIGVQPRQQDRQPARQATLAELQ